MKKKQDRSRVSAILTSYWKGAVVHAAVKIGLFESIYHKTNTLEELANSLDCVPGILSNVLYSLERMKLVKSISGKWCLTPDGEILSSKNKMSLEMSALMWWDVHLDAWRHLDHTIKTGEPSFNQLFEAPFFSWLEKNHENRRLYQKSMSEYAKIDYLRVPEILAKYPIKTCIDVGGGQGTLANMILVENPDIDISVLDLPHVINDIKTERGLINYIQGDIFDLPTSQYDAVILARILHDWNDTKCTIILENCRRLLRNKGYLIIIERLPKSSEFSLLNLDLAVMNNGTERTITIYQKIIQSANLKIIDQYGINEQITCLICQNQ